MGSDSAHDGLIQKDFDTVAAVFHLSGVIQDATLARMRKQDLEATFAPKVRGIHTLQQEPCRSIQVSVMELAEANMVNCFKSQLATKLANLLL